MNPSTYARNLLACLAATYVVGCVIGAVIHLIYINL